MPAPLESNGHPVTDDQQALSAARRPKIGYVAALSGFLVLAIAAGIIGYLRAGDAQARASSARSADEQGQTACGAVDAIIKSPNLNPLDASLIGFQGTYSTNNLIRKKGKELYGRGEALSHASLAREMGMNEATKMTKVELVKFRTTCIKLGYNTNVPE